MLTIYINTLGKEKHYIREQSVGSLQKFGAYEGQLVIPYLSMIMDLKTKGQAELGIKQDIYECIQLYVEVLTRKLVCELLVYAPMAVNLLLRILKA